jgi:hypothetical protein
MLHSTGWPPKADRVERPSEAGDAGSVDVSYWEKASTLRSSAKQIPDLAAIMNPASEELIGKDRSASESGHGSD